MSLKWEDIETNHFMAKKKRRECMNEIAKRKMSEEETMEKSLDLVNGSSVAFLGTVGVDGYPNIKGMLKPKNSDLREVWFSTNTSSEKVGQILANKKTCVYFVDMERFMGLMLVGETEATRCAEVRRMIWEEGDERYYPKGIDDPDFTVLHFRAHEGNFYHRLTKRKFKIK